MTIVTFITTCNCFNFFWKSFLKIFNARLNLSVFDYCLEGTNYWSTNVSTTDRYRLKLLITVTNLYYKFINGQTFNYYLNLTQIILYFRSPSLTNLFWNPPLSFPWSSASIFPSFPRSQKRIWSCFDAQSVEAHHENSQPEIIKLFYCFKMLGLSWWLNLLGFWDAIPKLCHMVRLQQVALY